MQILEMSDEYALIWSKINQSNYCLLSGNL